MDYNRIASDILENVGGKDNVKSVTHCFTRLRFVLKDESKAKKEIVFSPRKLAGMAKMIPMVAPKAAPEEIPSTKGSAIGFLKIAWYTPPHRASAPPTRKASRLLGKRRSHIIVFFAPKASASVSNSPVILFVNTMRVSLIVISAAPKKVHTKITAATHSKEKMTAAIHLFFILIVQLSCMNQFAQRFQTF